MCVCVFNEHLVIKQAKMKLREGQFRNVDASDCANTQYCTHVSILNVGKGICYLTLSSLVRDHFASHLSNDAATVHQSMSSLIAKYIHQANGLRANLIPQKLVVLGVIKSSKELLLNL